MKTMVGMLMGLLLSFNALAEVQVISQQQLLDLKKSDKAFLLLDVRSPDEYAAGHIEGAVNVEFSSIADAMDQLKDWKDKTVVVYCRSGRRAGIAERYLEAQGFSGLQHLDGDMLGWNKQGLPVQQ